MSLDIAYRREPTMGFCGKPAYEAASRSSSEVGGWRPARLSGNAALLPERELMVDRQKDAIRNNGISAGYMRNRLDAVIGAGLKLIPQPDYMALGQTAEWADTWGRSVKSLWKQFAEDIDCWIDWRRRCNAAQLQKLLYTSYIFNAEMIVVNEWRSRKRGAGSRTAFNVIDPDLLCNPNGEADTDVLKAGVQLDPETKEPVGYWFRQQHPSDSGQYGMSALPYWKYVPRYTAWGRIQVVHVFEVEYPDQVRGRPTFASALLGLKCLEKFERTSLQTQIIQAMYAAVVESTAPTADMFGALGGRPGEEAGALAQYMGAQDGYYEGLGGIRVGDSLATHLMPGEKLDFKTPGNVAPTLDAFHHKSMLNLSRALPGISYEQLSGDYSKTNYSSARAADLAPWRFIMGERENIAKPVFQHMYACCLEEWTDDGRVLLPANAPSFYEAKTAYCGLRLIGAPRGHIDEEKAQRAKKLRRDMGTLTHEDDCAEEGLDGDEVIDRLALEKAKFTAAGVSELLPGAMVLAQQELAEAQAANNDANDAAERKESGPTNNDAARA